MNSRQECKSVLALLGFFSLLSASGAWKFSQGPKALVQALVPGPWPCSSWARVPGPGPGPRSLAQVPGPASWPRSLAQVPGLVPWPWSLAWGPGLGLCGHAGLHSVAMQVSIVWPYNMCGFNCVSCIGEHWVGCQACPNRGKHSHLDFTPPWRGRSGRAQDKR